MSMLHVTAWSRIWNVASLFAKALALTVALFGLARGDAPPSAPQKPAVQSNQWLSAISSRAVESYLDQVDVKLLIFPVGNSAQQPMVQQAAEALLEALAQSTKVRAVRLVSPVLALDSELAQAARLEQADIVLVVRVSVDDPSSVIVKVLDRQGTVLTRFSAKPSRPVPERRGPDLVRVSLRPIGTPPGDVRLLRFGKYTDVEVGDCHSNEDGESVCESGVIRYESWNEICMGFCQVDAYRQDRLRVEVRGVGHRGPFTVRNVPGSQATVEVRVTPTKRKFLISGLLLTVMGGVATTASLALLFWRETDWSIASLAIGLPSVGVGIGLLVGARRRVSYLVPEANPLVPDLPP